MSKSVLNNHSPAEPRTIRDSQSLSLYKESHNAFSLTYLQLIKSPVFESTVGTPDPQNDFKLWVICHRTMGNLFGGLVFVLLFWFLVCSFVLNKESVTF